MAIKKDNNRAEILTLLKSQEARRSSFESSEQISIAISSD